MRFSRVNLVDLNNLDDRLILSSHFLFENKEFHVKSFFQFFNNKKSVFNISYQEPHSRQEVCSWKNEQEICNYCAQCIKIQCNAQKCNLMQYEVRKIQCKCATVHYIQCNLMQYEVCTTSSANSPMTDTKETHWCCKSHHI